MRLNLYEAFAGIGSQHSAFRNLKKKYDIDLNLVGISEWNVYAIIGYMAINNIEYSCEEIKFNRKELEEYFLQQEYSLDGKSVAKSLKGISTENLKILFYAQHKLSITPNIMNLKGEDLICKDIDVFTYSFPCQDLSVAGKQKGMKKGENTRSGLLWEVERVLNEIVSIDSTKLPKYLVMENVPQIINLNNIEDYKEWNNFLNSLGYTTFDGIVNSYDVGVAQWRRRFFAISILNYKGALNNKKPIMEILNDFYQFKYKHKSLKSIIKTKKDFIKKDKGIEYFEEACNATPKHTSSRMKMYKTEKKLSNPDGSIPLKKDGKPNFCRTITTKQDRWGNAGIIHFDGKFFEDGTRSIFRYLTPRESFLLMGYSEKQFQSLKNKDVPDSELNKLAGNSIVVTVLELLFEVFIICEENKNVLK